MKNITLKKSTDMKTNYMSSPFTDKLTMTDGIDNELWEDIASLMDKCFEQATYLRANLEELSDLMFQADAYMRDADGDALGVDYDTIMDYANNVAEVENNLDYLTDPNLEIGGVI